MTWKHLLAASLLTAFTQGAALAQSFPPAGDAVRGEQVYRERCMACHALDANRVGPAHRGVFGRRAGQAPGYDYSRALRRTSVTWNEVTLDQWLTNPQALIPGQRMNFRLGAPQMRADVIAYLRAQSVRPTPAANR